VSVTLASVGEAMALVGQSLGETEWLTVTQDMVDDFARITGDQQWIHVDPERAREGPFGACIAHGNLTLSIAGGGFFHELVRTSAKSGVNYGMEKVRFPAPVRVGCRIRGQATLTLAEMPSPDAVQLTVRMSVEVEGESRPACVADLIARYRF
jgi:acyl dehydratase